MTKKEIRNCIFMGIGFTTIFLIFLFHLVKTINTLLNGYNILIDRVNIKYNETMSHQTLLFFGESVESVNLLVDIIIILVVVFIGLMIFLKVYWSFKED